MEEQKPEIVIERDIEEEKKEIEVIEKNIERINEKLLDKVPSHFSKRDIINALFGSMILGLSFILNGATIPTAVNLTWLHIEFIVIITVIVLMGEIYFISYTRVKDKDQRKLGQFVTKRLVVLYGISIMVSFIIVYLFNMNNNPLVGGLFANVLKIVCLVSFPSAVGAAVPSLLKQY